MWEQVHIGIVCGRRFASNVRSGIQVGEKCVAVNGAKRKSKHRVQQIRRIEVQLQVSGQD